MISAGARTTARKIWLRIHLCLGLSAGLVLAVAGLTGSLLVFYLDIDAWLNPPLQLPLRAEPAPIYENAFQALRASQPHRGGAWRLELPSQGRGVITARYDKPEETQGHAFAPLIVSIDPQTSEILRSQFWGRSAMTWIYDLHYALLLERTGHIAMTIIGGLGILSIGTGLYLWWPRKRNFMTALAIRLRASPQRLTYDLHKLAGVYLLPVVLVVVVTGMLLELPGTFNPIIGRWSALTPYPAYGSSLKNAPRLTLDRAITIARGKFPGADVRWIETPSGARGSYRVILRQDGEPSHRFPRTNVWIDQYSGNILGIRDPRRNSAGDTLLDWLHPLHGGEAFGLPGRLLVLLSGLALPLLFITGVLRWWQKRRARSTAFARTAATFRQVPKRFRSSR
ncbi:PepSY-associated TM helix domain-containing protein [Cupriavidus basilensis]|uniref:PepSY-associated TM helix domain-containing protein n=1 Tax=Cupriavidus basilensis TaxID=68895 RepID=UPI00157B7245|nr:PepSY domain-containing protein [Cupriavidus basilensis]NUA31054.1 PepSY domain-containing protein [Cupriavidus basilensis]